MKIYFDQKIPKKDEPWEYDYYYGEITEDNKIIKKRIIIILIFINYHLLHMFLQ